MKTLILTFLLSVAPATMCFKVGERTSGLYKTCYYRCPAGEVAITVRSHQLCPLSVDR